MPVWRWSLSVNVIINKFVELKCLTETKIQILYIIGKLFPNRAIIPKFAFEMESFSDVKFKKRPGCHGNCIILITHVSTLLRWDVKWFDICLPTLLDQQ